VRERKNKKRAKKNVIAENHRQHSLSDSKIKTQPEEQPHDDESPRCMEGGGGGNELSLDWGEIHVRLRLERKNSKVL